MELGDLKGPIVIPQRPAPREDYASSYFFTPNFFYQVDESSSVETLLGRVHKHVERIASISDEEYADFNKYWSVPSNGWYGRYDFVKVKYDYVSFEVRRMVTEILGAKIPEEDLGRLILEIIKCQDGQVFKVFDSNQWAYSTDNMLINSFGVISATCSTDYVQLFSYFSSTQAASKTDLANITETMRKRHKNILGRWLALHFVREFMN